MQQQPPGPYNHPRNGAPHPAAPNGSIAGDLAELDAQPQRGLMDYLFIIRERWILAFTVGAVVSLLYGFYALSRPPVYSAGAVMIFEEQSDMVVDIEQVDSSMEVRNERAMQNQLQQIRSNTFRNYVAATFKKHEAANIIRPYVDPGKPMPSVEGVLENVVHFDWKTGTQIVTVRCEHPYPEVAALVANRFAREYVRYMLDRAGSSNMAAVTFLQEQAEDLRKRIESGDAQLQQYRQRFNLVSIEDNQGLIVDRMNNLNAALDAARVEGVALQSQFDQINAARESGADLSDMPALAGDAALADCMVKIAEAERDRAMLAERYLRLHPKMIENATRLQKLTEDRDRIMIRVTDRLENAVAENTRRQVALAKGVDQAEAEAMELDRRGIEYRVLQRRVENDKATYDAIVSRLNETTISSQLNNTNIRIADEATVPALPSSPKKMTAARNMVALFLLAFVGLPIGLSYLDSRVKSVWDIEQYLKRPFLGDVPRVRKMGKNTKAGSTLLDTDDSGLIECFRALLANVRLGSDQPFPKSIVVTSTLPKEGKTFVSANFAIAFGQHGVKTLLVDMDLRRPSLHTLFGVPNTAGTLRWFEDEGDAETLLGIRKIGPNVDILCAGGSTRKPTELVSSPRFPELLRQLKQRYDLVVIDTPPVGLFPDAAFVSEHADEVLFVCHYNHVPRQKVRFALRRIDLSGVRVTGVVVNKLDKGGVHGHYAYGYYGYYADYYGKQYRAYNTAATAGATSRNGVNGQHAANLTSKKDSRDDRAAKSIRS